MVDGEPLNDRDMMGYYIILAAAGHDTTSASTAGAMLALAQDPAQWARVRADRSLLPGIVEEAIRWTTPVQHFMRTAAEDTEVGGQAIAKGDWLMMNYVAANHGPAHFDDPRRFDAARGPTATSPSARARTSVSACISPGLRCESCSKRCSTGSRASNWQANPRVPNRPSSAGSRRCRCASLRPDSLPERSGSGTCG